MFDHLSAGCEDVRQRGWVCAFREFNLNATSVTMCNSHMVVWRRLMTNKAAVLCASKLCDELCKEIKEFLFEGKQPSC